MVIPLAFLVSSQNGSSTPKFADISAKQILTHVRELASDRFEGRGPTTKGEELTIAYLIRQLKGAGLMPGNPNGTYVQGVPMVGYRSQPNLTFTVRSKTLPMQFPDDFIHEFPRLTSHAEAIAAPVIFGGYGIVAPEFGWDDYKDTNVAGKIVLLMGGEPSRPDKKNPKNLDAKFFREKCELGTRVAIIKRNVSE